MSNCPTCGAKYDPTVADAAKRSNDIDDTDPDDFGKNLNALDPSYGDGRGNTHTDNVVGKSFASDRERQNLKDLLPGMTDYGINKLKSNVRGGIGTKKFGRNKPGGGPFATGE